MESQPQNPEFRNSPENFHPCIILIISWITIPCSLYLLLKNNDNVVPALKIDMLMEIYTTKAHLELNYSSY